MNSWHIYNAQVITPFRLIEHGEVLIEQGRIVSVGEPTGTVSIEKDRGTIDAQGM